MSNVQNNKLELLPHQQEAYTEVEKLFKEKRKAAVIFPTGCGKSFVTLKYILEHPDDRILFLAPRNAIKDQIYEYIVRYIGGDTRSIEEIQKENGSMKQAAKQYIPNIECLLYQTILGIDEKESVDEVILKLKPDVIVIDEMHHLKTKKSKEDKEISEIFDEDDEEVDDDADRDVEETDENIDRRTDEDSDGKVKQENKWGQKFNRLLEMNPQAKLLGLSATPIRNDGANVVERIFEGSIASEISLFEAIELGIIYPPQYVVPDFVEKGELESLLEQINSVEDEEKRRELKEKYDELVKKSDKASGIPDLLRENITEKDGKYIVFCKDVKDMQEKMSKAKEWFGEIDDEPIIYGIHAKDSTSAEQLAEFNNKKSEHLKLMYCVGMIDEGVHLNDVSGVILSAKTGSRPTYLQRIGRAISSGKNKKQAIVIDLVNNNEILDDETNIQYGYEVTDLEALEKLIEWMENKNDGKIPQYSEEKSIKEKAMAKRYARINNKYLKYVQNSELLKILDDEEKSEYEEIIKLGKTVGMFENVINIDFDDENRIDMAIDTFLNGIEIKGVRKDFRKILGDEILNISIFKKNFEEYKAWCEKNGRLPRTTISKNGIIIRGAEKIENETAEQMELRIGNKKRNFLNKIKGKKNLSEEEQQIEQGYEELEKIYKEKSIARQNFEECKAWCEEYQTIPRSKISGVSVAKAGEKETAEQMELRLGTAKYWFYYRTKEKKNLSEEEQQIKQGYEELERKYKKESIVLQNLEEYKAWCEEYQMIPRSKISGVSVAKAGEKETAEQMELRLGITRANFFASRKKTIQDLSEEEKYIKRCYEELDEKYPDAKKKKSMMIMKQNFEECKAWCEKSQTIPRMKISGVSAAKEGEKETAEQTERRLGLAKKNFLNKIKGKKNLSEEELYIKRGYEELDEKYPIVASKGRKRKQSATNIAQVTKNVPLSEAQEASEFLEEISNENSKNVAEYNDE